MAFGNALREAIMRDPVRFDRVAILRETEEPLTRAARQVIRALRKPREQ
jgi:fructose-bisphosphate aldolase class II